MTELPYNPELERRKGLTFMQAEGLAPLPRQLKREELPDALRQDLADFFYGVLLCEKSGRHPGNLSVAEGELLLPVWRSSLFNGGVRNFPTERYDWRQKTVHICTLEEWKKVYELLACLLSAPACSARLKEIINIILTRHRAAYRVIEDTLVPVVSEADADALKKNLAPLRETGEESVMQHFKEAAMELGQGKYNKSVHSSAMGLEKALKKQHKKESFKSGVEKLCREGKIHPALAESIKKVYAFACDALDVRHPGDESKKAPVTEDTALFVFSACAASANYIINLTNPPQA